MANLFYYQLEHFLERYLLKLALIVSLEDATQRSDQYIASLQVNYKQFDNFIENMNVGTRNDWFVYERKAEKYISDVMHHTDAIGSFNGNDPIKMSWNEHVWPILQNMDKTRLKSQFPRFPP